ncbi:LacI family DNA-binding transcriptional regulator [Paenibacillus arenilitoris]|uniref:LacI family DNA-binding transcriptional regulator n=1 Tax=Paenibacillus arenilitoris TaxID=2772299 RepID=A0A927CQ91_9BACL|nr:LacI family DNA-binding transcriptional regulator [Paenibacillus arenilitoris]MBD2870276.1 LacI family DNA-binding transcriptional regulator [Paenibacillus arenilitoris]
MKKRVKLADIANELGLSKMAVSMALRGDTSISKETTERVRSKASELGYTPNRMAQGLVRGKSYTIALVIAGPFHDDYQNQIIKGAVPYAMKRGYTISVSPMAGNPERESSYIEKFKDIVADGVMAFPSPEVKNYRKLKDDGMPYVLYTKFFYDLESDYVVCNDELGGYLMTRHLLELGHVDIGFVYDEKLKESSEVVERLKGMRRALAEQGIEHGDDRLLPFALHYNLEDMDDNAILESNPAFERALRSGNRPTALFVCNDITATSVYIAIKKMGLRIPDDISIGGYEGVYLGSIVDPPLTTVATPIQEMGRRACEILIDKIEGKSDSDQIFRLKLDPKLLVRASTKAVSPVAKKEQD